MHFALYYPGFVQDGLVYDEYFADEHTKPLWKFRGSLNLFSRNKGDLGAVSKKRKLRIAFDYFTPGFLLKIDDKEFDLKKGRVFTVDANGKLQQLAIQDPVVGKSGVGAGVVACS